MNGTLGLVPASRFPAFSLLLLDPTHALFSNTQCASEQVRDFTLTNSEGLAVLGTHDPTGKFALLDHVPFRANQLVVYRADQATNISAR